MHFEWKLNNMNTNTHKSYFNKLSEYLIKIQIILCTFLYKVFPATIFLTFTIKQETVVIIEDGTVNIAIYNILYRSNYFSKLHLL